MTEPTATKNHPRRPRVTSFDRVVLLVIAALLLGVVATVLLGDRVGVTLVRVGPQGVARSTSAITMQFSEPMDRASVEQRLRVEPAVDGAFSWTGSTVLFRPAAPLEPGGSYTVVLEQGARSEEGRLVLSEQRYSFTVASPRIAYLAPADGSPQNIWLANVDDPSSAEQITFSPTGIYDFGVSPDGSQIAFAERRAETNTSDIKLLDLATGGITQVTNCEDSDCTTPVWRPDGRVIAYNRVDFNSVPGAQGSAAPTRVWLLDLTAVPATTRPLFADLQILGHSPQWSADGQRIAVYNRDEGILIYDFASSNIAVVPTRGGSAGALSPDGTQVVYAELTIVEDQQPRSYLLLADTETQELRLLSHPEDPIMDERAEWRPDGEALAVARRYEDERYTRGPQIYLMDPDDGSVVPLTDDPRYAHFFFSWDPTGDRLLIQRFPELTESGDMNPDGRPEIWTLDITSGDLTLVTTNAYHPRWVP